MQNNKLKNRIKHRIFWLTGLPCAGKTTIAKALSNKIDAEILDGDDIRNIFHNSDFSIEGRRRHMMSVAELAYRFSKYANVVVALVSPIKTVREKIRQKYHNVKEVYIKCDIKECIRRDVKGMYARALKGEIKNFTGIDAKYEEPGSDILSVDTVGNTVEECVDIILSNTDLSLKSIE